MKEEKENMKEKHNGALVSKRREPVRSKSGSEFPWLSGKNTNDSQKDDKSESWEVIQRPSPVKAKSESVLPPNREKPTPSIPVRPDTGEGKQATSCPL
jgi:hypothetical protein